MKNKTPHKRRSTPKLKDEVGETFYKGKVKTEKVKYKHMSHWLEEDDLLDLRIQEEE